MSPTTPRARARRPRGSRTLAMERRAERYHHPLVLLQPPSQTARRSHSPGCPTGSCRPSEQGPRRRDRRRPDVPGGRRAEAPGAHCLARHYINLGDVLLTTTFAGYAAAGGLKLPTRISTMVDAFTTGEYEVSISSRRRAIWRRRRRPRASSRPRRA